MSMCRVVSYVVWRGCAVTSALSWQNSVSLWPASFCTPRPNFPVTRGFSWLPTFAFQSPIIKRYPFWVLVLEGLVGLYRTAQLQLLQHYWSRHRRITVILNDLPWKWTEIILSLLRLHPSTAFQTLLLTMRATSFLNKRFLPPVVDIMVIGIKFTHSHPF